MGLGGLSEELTVAFIGVETNKYHNEYKISYFDFVLQEDVDCPNQTLIKNMEKRTFLSYQGLLNLSTINCEIQS